MAGRDFASEKKPDESDTVAQNTHFYFMEEKGDC
jgi:hypothetical protein